MIIFSRIANKYWKAHFQNIWRKTTKEQLLDYLLTASFFFSTSIYFICSFLYLFFGCANCTQTPIEFHWSTGAQRRRVHSLQHSDKTGEREQGWLCESSSKLFHPKFRINAQRSFKVNDRDQVLKAWHVLQQDLLLNRNKWDLVTYWRKQWVTN